MNLPSPTCPAPRRQAAFTMVEIAISLGVIAFALVAIIGVLPRGMNVQRDNREETIINQEAAVFAEAIRGGARAIDDLTNHVYAITNYWTIWEVDTNAPGRTNLVSAAPGFDTDGYVYADSDVHSIAGKPWLPITNGLRIVGLLGRPKYQPWGANQFRSNHVVAFVHAMSGVAAEKAPQNNADVRGDSFSYRMISESQPTPLFFSPVAPPVNTPEYTRYTNYTAYIRQLTNNLSELRLTFRWPLTPRGVPGNGRQTFRMAVAGSLQTTNDPYIAHPLFFFRPTTFELAKP